MVDIILENNKVDVLTSHRYELFFISIFGVKRVESKIKSSVHTNELDNLERSSSARVNFLKKFNKIRKTIVWVRYLRNLMLFPVKYLHVRKFLSEKEYDVVITNNMYNDLEHIFYYHGLNKVASIRNSPREVFFQRVLPKILPLKLYYGGVSFVSVSKDSEYELKAIFRDSFITTIYNPFDFDEINTLSNAKESNYYLEGNKKYFVIVGSLCKRKRVDLAIAAVAKLDLSVFLIIVGAGEEYKNLKLMAKELGVEDRVLFTGVVQNPYVIMKNALGTILTSESEGLPRVLVESLIVGTPVISTDCPTGPKELLGEKSKFLIPMKDDLYIIDKLTQRLEVLIDNNDYPYIELSMFHPDEIVRNWEKLLFSKVNR
ncbi:glycosyltransferase [Shewanella algae]|uniref:glycosyltransferase n=1 Tax=Shewanella algae TaxID=38313 RepID=UPI001AAF85E3|nr:glycosyltransferase [Shewanella algae]MBO2590368.1 glycosyltransferase [Shewanella algae]